MKSKKTRKSRVSTPWLNCTHSSTKCCFQASSSYHALADSWHLNQLKFFLSGDCTFLTKPSGSFRSVEGDRDSVLG
jgi:hypothetical protein